MPRVSALLALWVCAFAACSDNGPGGAGDPCLTGAECGGDTVCFETAERGRECMTLCDPATTRLCDDDSVCLAAASAAVCYTGGELGLGSVCETSDVCEPGAVCVLLDGATDAQCRRACDRRAPSGCGAGETCELVGEEPAGFCAPPPPAPPAE